MVFIQEMIYLEINNGTYAISLDDKQSKETHCVSLITDKNTNVCVDSFGIEDIPQDVLNRITDKFITHKIFRIQFPDSIMCWLYCFAFIGFMIAGINLLDYTN